MEPIEDNQQVAPGNQDPQVTPPSSRKIIAILIGIMLLLLILLLGARYFMGGINDQQTIAVKPSQPIENIPTSSETIPTDTPVLSTPTNTPGTILPLPVWTPSSVQLNDSNLLLQGYYNWYVACQKQLFANVDVSSKYNSRENCSFNKPGVFTNNLVNIVQKAEDYGHYDAVLCAQNIPQAITFEKAVVANTHASAIVHTIWGASPIQNIPVGLDMENGAWKISSISCPEEQGGTMAP